MTRNPKTPEFRTSSGNVFTDLRVRDGDQELVKADLVKAICSLVSQMELRQVDVATRLGISQPKVSLLMGGRTDGFSTEMLMRLLNRLGQRIEIVVKPSPTGRLIGDTHVQYDEAMILEHRAPAYGQGSARGRTSGPAGNVSSLGGRVDRVRSPSGSVRTAGRNDVAAKRSSRVRKKK